MSIREKVLVTGADGFIGSHLVERLVRDGYDVRAFVFYNSFNSWGWLDSASADVRRSIEVVAGDVRDPFGVREAVRGCDAVLHLAALIAIPYSYRSPAAYVETNITGTLNVLQAAREFGVRRMVHTSTSETYGTAQFVPITELHPQVGQSPYAATKIAADQMAISFHRSFDLPVTVLRPFNTYGPRQSARAVIPTIIVQSLAGDGQVRLGSRHPTRDFTLVHDTVGGFVAMLETTQPVEGEVINIGSGFEISIGETAEVIAQAIGRELNIVFDEDRVRPSNSEVERLWAGTEKAKELVGWQPGHAGLDGFRRGIAETVEWFREGENLGRYKSDIYNL